MYLGAHVGIAGGLEQAVADGVRIGCEAIQIFSKSPQMWAGAPIAPEAAERFRRAVAAAGLRATAVHHAYLLNLASPKAALLARSRTAIRDEIQRAELLGADALILHPGAHTGSGVPAGLGSIARELDAALADVPGQRTRVLLENAAGQGTTLGAKFEELQAMLAGLSARPRVGVALDTCHLFAAGYDLRTPESYGRVVDAIESTFGTKEVHAFHLNDAREGLGSHRDRHANIGRGEIGREGFRPLLTDPRWRAVPGYLETPLDSDDYARYVEDLRTLAEVRDVPRVSGTRRTNAPRTPRRPARG